MPTPRTDPAETAAALAEWATSSGAPLPRARLATAVRGTLEMLAAESPGRAVELRVPPFAAVQAIAGTRHTRGTPPAVVETDPQTWLELAVGDLDWASARADGRISASGERSDLTDLLPMPGPRRTARAARQASRDPEHDPARAGDGAEPQ